MLEKIPVYELPFSDKKKLELKIYKVHGSEIQRNDYPHKTEFPHKHNYYDQVHQVKDYAELLGESPIVLNRAIKSVTDKTASEIIIERLILKAKRLLLFSDLSNKEVAYKLNYEDPSYFARIFRKKTSFTPSEFRKIMKEKYR